jgi:hypothetical protein
LAASRERNLINAKAGTPVPAFFAGPPAQAGPNAWSTPSPGRLAQTADKLESAKPQKQSSAPPPFLV